ncbi:MAG: GAK system ATP-grasp enzyme [Planctomycetes bacterium]|nr:GAK system ATP-grasp enzyme [Planctomycetota bacterium]
MTELAVVGTPGGWSSEHLADSFSARTGSRYLIDMSRVVLDMSAGSVLADTDTGVVDLCRLDGIFIKKIGHEYCPDMLDRLEILRYVEGRGVPMFSSPSRILRLLDRLACTVSLAAAAIPMPDTVVTEDVGRAAEAIRRFGRAVLKPLYSTKARGMRVVDVSDGDENIDRALAEFVAAGNPMIYVQKWLDLAGRDLGVVFLGGDYVGSYARVGKADSWNTTIRDGGRYERANPPDEWIDMARRAQAPFGLDFTCVDVAETAAGPIVFEVSAFGGFRGLRDGLGIDAGDTITDYVLDVLAKRRPSPRAV